MNKDIKTEKELLKQKTEEEINLIKQKIRTEKLTHAKLIRLFIGAVALFFLIQKPESVINRKSSIETINRERSKLVLQILKEDNPLVRAKALKIIRATYPSISGVLDSIEIEIEESTQSEIIVTYKNKLKELEEKKKVIENNIKKSEDQLEIQVLQNNLEMVEIEIKNIQSFLKN